MKKFRELMEKAGDTAVFTFGRFNPPTTGHEKLIQAVAKQQGKNAGSKMYIYASQSNDPKKNPLPYAKKIAYMRKMFKKYAKNIITAKPRTAIEVAVELHNKGHRAIVMVVGSDRVAEFDRLLNEYNGVKSRHGYYGFDNIEVISAGERDPDAEGVEGMSASKMRQAAADGDFQSFEMGLPSSFAQRKELYRDVRKGMGMREEREMGDMTDMEYLRDLYLTGKIWNAGDLIEAKGVKGHIVRKGTNYVSFADDNGKVHKCWIHEIQLNEAMSNMDKMRAALPKKGRDAWDKSANKDKGKPWVKLTKKGSMTTWNVQKGTKDYDKYKKMGFSEEVELDERNYRKEYDNYQGTPEQIARRSSRNKARRVMGDKTKIGMDVGHKDNNPLNNDPKNLRNEDPTKNRREPRLREEDEVDEMTSSLPWLNKAVAKIHQITHPRGYEKLVKRYMDGMKDKKHREHPGQWASDLAREYKGVEGRDFIRYINKLVDKGKLPQELKAEIKMEQMSFKSFVEVLNKNADQGDYIDDFVKSDAPQFKGKSKEKRVAMAVAAYKDKNEGAYGHEKQDKDIEDKDGTQPAKYHKGLSKSTKDKRDAHFKKKKAGPAPGDADAETKPSVHTKQFKKMYGEMVDITENKGLKNKAEKSKVSYGILKKVYDRGLAAYKTGHRPGTSAPQWAMARVNSFLTGGGARKADNDLWKQTNKEDTDVWNLQDACWDGYKQVGMKKKGGKDVPNCVPEEFELNEWGEVEEESEYQGRKVTLNKPMQGDVKKSKVFVKNASGNVVKVNFGDPNMTIKKSDPARRRSFRARHNCENPGPKWKARYWSCKAW